MPSGLGKKYSRTYRVAAALILFIVPAGFYALFSRYHLLGTLPLFSSLAVWTAAVVIVWGAAVLAMTMAASWTDAIDRTFREKGFQERERIKLLWTLALMPAILGCLLALYSFLQVPRPGQEYTVLRVLTLALGFVPVTFYGLARAGRVTDRIAGGGPEAGEPAMDYLQTAWWPAVVIFMTMVLTPFFGAGIAASQIWRLAPRNRGLLYALIVLSGILITLLAAPLAASMRRVHESEAEAYQAFSLYAALTLFTGTAYVIVIKSGLLFRKG